jgi:putative transcriptional regulator
MNKRNLFAELSAGLTEAKAHDEGKLTLKSYQFKDTNELTISPNEIALLRENFNKSRGVFAKLMHTSARTLENWEQGRSVPNGQAVTLLKLVQRYPETLHQIADL